MEAEDAPRVLAVDDDLTILKIVQLILEDAGFEVWTASSGRQALQILEERGLPHLALVDIMMPGMNGLELCRQIHQSLDLPVIILTSVSDVKTVVEAIDEVAEDYVTKPFEPDELVARTRRLLRRIGDYSYALESRVRIDEHLALEFGRRRAIVDGRSVELTPIETKLLYLLVRSAGRTLQNAYLLRRLWPMEDAFEEALRTHVWRLRKKIAATPRRYLETVRGVGYRFRAPTRS